MKDLKTHPRKSDESETYTEDYSFSASTHHCAIVHNDSYYLRDDSGSEKVKEYIRASE